MTRMTSRRRWATALIATTTAAPLLLTGAATATWAAATPLETPGVVDELAPGAEVADIAAVPDEQEPPASEIAGDPPVGGTEADAPVPGRDPQPVSTNDPQSSLTLTVDVPELDTYTWYDEPIDLGITARSRIGAATAIEWIAFGAQTGSGEVPGPRFTLPITATGVTTVTITAFDEEGNETEPVTRTIKIDPTPAEIALSEPSLPVYRLGDSVRVGLACVDPESALYSCRFSFHGAVYGDGVTIAMDSLGTFSAFAYARNNAGTYTETPRGSIRVIEDEADAPEVEVTAPDAPGGWYDGPVEIALTADDGDGAGVRSIEYRTLEDGVPGSWVVVEGDTATFTTTGEGDNRYQYRSTDWFGNVGVTQTVSFPTDATAPTVTVGIPSDGVTVEPDEELALEYTCTDARSGVAVCDGPVASGALLDTSEEGTFEVVILAVDEAGNETRVVREYTVAEPDTTGPAVSFRHLPPTRSGWFHTAPDVEIAAVDPSALGEFRWELTHPDGSVERRTVPAGETTVQLPAADLGEGVWRILVVASDEHGNQTQAQATLRIDGTAPTVTIDAPGNAPALVAAVDEFAQGSVVEFAFTCDDAVSGVESCVSSVGDTLPTDEAGDFVAEVVALDAAGHRTVQQLEYTVVASDEPVPGPGTGGGAPGAPALAVTGSEPIVATVLLALGLLVVGGAAAGSVVMVRRGR